MKHTKAPWRISPVRTTNKFGTQGIDITSHNYRDFATVWNMDGMEDENEANAKLIAAAPELLEALKELLRINDSTDDYETKVNDMVVGLYNAKQAIKKATL